MIRATLDVSVLASGFLAETGTPAALIDYWTDLAYELVISEHILEGLTRAWGKPYYHARFTPDQVRQSLRPATHRGHDRGSDDHSARGRRGFRG